MPLYQVTPLADNFDKLASAIRSAEPALDAFELANRTGYLIEFNGTSVELSHALKLTNPDRSVPSELGPALVTSITSYYGRGPTPMWEWMKTRMER